MLAKLSTRRYPAGLEPVGSSVQHAACGTSKSTSRRFVARTEHALADLLAQDLTGLDLVALMVDGIRVAEHCCGRARHHAGWDQGPARAGRGRDRERHRGDRPAGRAAGARPGRYPADPGRDRRRQALRRAVNDVFDHPVIQRCQLHKLRNVTDRLPDTLASTVAKRMRVAYHILDPLVAEAELERLLSLERAHPGAAASLREGLAETLTITRWVCHPPSLGACAARTPSSR